MPALQLALLSLILNITRIMPSDSADGIEDGGVGPGVGGVAAFEGEFCGDAEEGVEVGGAGADFEDGVCVDDGGFTGGVIGEHGVVD